MGSFGKEKVYFFSRHTDRELRIHQLFTVQIDPVGPLTGDVHLPAAAQKDPRDIPAPPLAYLPISVRMVSLETAGTTYKVQQAASGTASGQGLKPPHSSGRCRRK